MSVFAWSMIGLLMWNSITKLSWLAKGEAPARKMANEALDVAAYAALIVWGICVITRDAK